MALMSHAAPSRAPIRLAILDDNSFVRGSDSIVRSPTATFHEFAATVIRRGPFAPADYLAPVRPASEADIPGLGSALDGAVLRVVPTAPFDGIAAYVADGRRILADNWPIIRSTVERADLVWIKAPASNAPLVALACHQVGIPRFTWVAGSVRDVVRGQHRKGVSGLAARAAAVAYDATTRVLQRTGPSIRVGAEQFTSVVSAGDIQATMSRDASMSAPAAVAGPLRLIWAGRVAAEKGLDVLLEAVAQLRASGCPVVLSIIGDGPQRSALEDRAMSLGVTGVVNWQGHISDRGSYLAALREADIFVLPSRAEGLPKVVVEAMSAGVPVIATRVGALPALLGDGRLGRLVAPGDPLALADAIASLGSDVDGRDTLRTAGLAFAAAHTAEAQADRLIEWLAGAFPELAWEGRVRP